MVKRWLGAAIGATVVVSVSSGLISCRAYGPQTELTSSGQGSYSFKRTPADPSEQAPTPAPSERVADGPRPSDVPQTADNQSPDTPQPANTQQAANSARPTSRPARPFHPVPETQMVLPGNGGVQQLWIPHPKPTPSN